MTAHELHFAESFASGYNGEDEVTLHCRLAYDSQHQTYRKYTSYHHYFFFTRLFVIQPSFTIPSRLLSQIESGESYTS